MKQIKQDDHKSLWERSSFDVVANVLNRDIVISMFGIKSRYYVHFRTK